MKTLARFGSSGCSLFPAARIRGRRADVLERRIPGDDQFRRQSDDGEEGVPDQLRRLVRLAARRLQGTRLQPRLPAGQDGAVYRYHDGLLERRERDAGRDETERIAFRIASPKSNCRLPASRRRSRRATTRNASATVRRNNARRRATRVAFAPAMRCGFGFAVRPNAVRFRSRSCPASRSCRSAEPCKNADGSCIAGRRAELARTLHSYNQAAVHDVTLSPLVGTSCVLSPQASCLPPSQIRDRASTETTMHKLGITDASFLYMESPSQSDEHRLGAAARRAAARSDSSTS